ncbi:ATP-binding protein, partial [Nonomuraea sp. NPDC003804]|uniref:ATP-binding protein n=1 Tax=Nonomuraea sp. NPDC003804 TaxID=3154547 RepID=UPI0033B7205D
MKQPQTLLVIPDPVSLMESMRAVGYTVEAAIADIIDNSLSAGALNIGIHYDASSSPYVAILDDGYGMEASELTDAMRHGSTNPTDSLRSA